MSILKLFCHVDDFCQWSVTRENAKLLGVTRKRGPAARLSLREAMTILIHFHQSHCRDFKACYMQHVCEHMRIEFPTLVSYTRFVALMPSALPAMSLCLRGRFGQATGVAFIDSTPLSVCHNLRIARHRVFAEGADGRVLGYASGGQEDGEEEGQSAQEGGLDALGCCHYFCSLT